MTAYEIVKSLALVPAVLLVGLAIGLIVMPWRRRSGYAIAWIFTLLLYAASTPYCSRRLGVWVETVPPLMDIAAAKDAQAIVVLSAGAGPGAPEYGGVRLDEYTLVRLRYAAHLQRQTGLPVLASGGPVRDTNTTYAAAMKVALEQDFGVPVAWVETMSRDTAENARYSATILQAADIKKIVLITHASHMPRSLALFAATGLDVIPAATDYTRAAEGVVSEWIPRMSALSTSYLALYEGLGQIWYAIKPAS